MRRTRDECLSLKTSSKKKIFPFSLSVPSYLYRVRSQRALSGIRRVFSHEIVEFGLDRPSHLSGHAIVEQHSV